MNATRIAPRPRTRCTAALLAVALLSAGCPFGPVDNELPFLDTSGNMSLDTATPLRLGPTDTLRFRGAIDNPADIDVFELGPLAPGDRIVVDVRRTSGNLDPVAAIFDERAYLVAFNDDRAPDASDLDPRLDIILRGERGTYYLGIIAYPGGTTSGAYEVAVEVQRGLGVPDPEPQIVFLEWRGGRGVVVANVGVFDLPPFSATDVGLPESQTQALKDRVEQIVAERYAGYGLLVLNSDEHIRPEAPHTTVYFGGDNARAFAISEQIDTFNADPWDDAIVFTESYRGAFRVDPTLEQMAQAIGNTVAHEIGHLLGLVHTADCDDLMDSTCYNERLLAAQQFSTAALAPSVFPLGFQAAEEILAWLLGLVGL